MILIRKIVNIIFTHVQKNLYENRYKIFEYKYNIDKDFKFKGVAIQLYGDGEIYLGSNSYIGNYSTIQSLEGSKVQIGNNCAISHNVRIYTTNRCSESIAKKDKVVSYKTGNVIIGDNVWIGANVFITEGVNVGNNVVIGANSVVTKSLPSNSVCAGSPAKVIKKY